MITFHSSFLDRAVHTLYLSIGPGMLNFCQAVLNFIFMANAIKNMRKSILVLLAIGELDTPRLRGGRLNRSRSCGSYKARLQ